MMRRLVLTVLVAAGLQLPSAFAAPHIGEQSSARCFSPPRPVAVTQAFPSLSKGDGLITDHLPGDSSRVYMLGRNGFLYRFNNDPAVSSKTVALDASALFAGTVEEGQSGMMDLAFHPDFAENGELYVSYTVPGEDRTSYVARYTSADGGLTFSPAGQVILSLRQPGSLFQNVGQIFFAQDGYLYIVFGDDGRQGMVQDPNTWYGKILRIDVDQGALYGIPPDNPYAGGGGLPEVYALGLRNPWGIAQDEVTGEIWMGDVGADDFEEINKLVKGANYGWPIKEGFGCLRGQPCDDTGLTDPIYEYSHAGGGCAVIGGHVYRGSQIPSLVGKYIFADLCTGEVHSLEETAAGPQVNLLADTDFLLRTISESSTQELLLIAGDSNRIQKLAPDTSGAGTAPPISETSCVVAVPDSNVNGTDDVAVLRHDPIVAEIHDGETGALIRKLGFLTSDYTPAATAVLPDTNGDSKPELAVLAVRNSDQRMVVQIRNVDNVGTPRSVFFATGHTPVALAVITDDTDQDGAPELVVLSTRNSDGRGLVEVKNAIGAPNTKTLWGPVGYVVQDVATLPDADGNLIPDIVLLATRISDGRILAQVRDADGSGTLYSTFFALNQSAIDLAVVPDKDNDGIPEVAVLSWNKIDGRLLVELKNASGTGNQFPIWLGAGYTGVGLTAITPADGSAIPEIGVLRQRNSDTRINVTVRNAIGADPFRTIWYTTGYTPRGLAVLPDLDENGVDEPAVLMTRDSDDRILVQSRNAFGAQAPRTYFFTP
jgi:glucose/arabinose dehydrogenase